MNKKEQAVEVLAKVLIKYRHTLTSSERRAIEEAIKSLSQKNINDAQAIVKVVLTALNLVLKPEVLERIGRIFEELLK